MHRRGFELPPTYHAFTGTATAATSSTSSCDVMHNIGSAPSSYMKTIQNIENGRSVNKNPVWADSGCDHNNTSCGAGKNDGGCCYNWLYTNTEYYLWDLTADKAVTFGTFTGTYAGNPVKVLGIDPLGGAPTTFKFMSRDYSNAKNLILRTGNGDGNSYFSKDDHYYMVACNGSSCSNTSPSILPYPIVVGAGPGLNFTGMQDAGSPSGWGVVFNVNGDAQSGAMHEGVEFYLYCGDSTTNHRGYLQDPPKHLNLKSSSKFYPLSCAVPFTSSETHKFQLRPKSGPKNVAPSQDVTYQQRICRGTPGKTCHDINGNLCGANKLNYCLPGSSKCAQCSIPIKGGDENTPIYICK